MGNSPSQLANEPAEEEPPDEFNLDDIKGDSELSSQDEGEPQEKRPSVPQKTSVEYERQKRDNLADGVRPPRLVRRGSLEKYGVYASSEDTDEVNTSQEEDSETDEHTESDGERSKEDVTEAKDEDNDEVDDNAENKGTESDSSEEETSSSGSLSPQASATATHAKSDPAHQRQPYKYDTDIGGGEDEARAFMFNGSRHSPLSSIVVEDDMLLAHEGYRGEEENDEDRGWEEGGRQQIRAKEHTVPLALGADIESPRNNAEIQNITRTMGVSGMDGDESDESDADSSADIDSGKFVSVEVDMRDMDGLDSDKHASSTKISLHDTDNPSLPNRNSGSKTGLKRKRKNTGEKASYKGTPGNPPKKLRRTRFSPTTSVDSNSPSKEAKMRHRPGSRPSILVQGSSDDREFFKFKNPHVAHTSPIGKRKANDEIPHFSSGAKMPGNLKVFSPFSEDSDPGDIATSIARRTFPAGRSRGNHITWEDTSTSIRSPSRELIHSSHDELESDYEFPADGASEDQEEGVESSDDDTHRNREYACRVCHRHFGSKVAFTKHKACSGIRKGLNVCSVCPETFNSIQDLGEHQQETGHGDGTGYSGQKGFFTDLEVHKLQNYRDRFCAEHDIDRGFFNSMMTDSCRRGKGFSWIYQFITKSDFLKEYYAVLPHRNRRSMHRYRERHFQNAKTGKEWSQEDDEQLAHLVGELGPKWIEIGQILSRTQDAVNQRWRNKVKYGDKSGEGKWTTAETETLRKAVERIRKRINAPLRSDPDRAISWSEVSKEMGNMRTAQQCSNHWRFVQSRPDSGEYRPRRLKAAESSIGSPMRVATRAKASSTLEMSETAHRSTTQKIPIESDQRTPARNGLVLSTSSEVVIEANSSPQLPLNLLGAKTPGKTISLSQAFRHTQANTSALRRSQRMSEVSGQLSDRPSPEIELRLRIVEKERPDGDQNERNDRSEETEEVKDMLTVRQRGEDSPPAGPQSETDSDAPESMNSESNTSSLPKSDHGDNKNQPSGESEGSDDDESEAVGIRQASSEGSLDRSNSSFTSSSGSDSDEDDEDDEDDDNDDEEDTMVSDTKKDFFMASIQATARKVQESSQKRYERDRAWAKVEVDDSDDDD